MRKAQKIIIIITLTVLLVAVLFPPCYVIGQTGSRKGIIGYNLRPFIFDVGLTDGNYLAYSKINHDILGLEILAILILGSIALILTVKKRS